MPRKSVTVRGQKFPPKSVEKFDQELFIHEEANGVEYDETDPRFFVHAETGSPDTDAREAEVNRLIRMYGLGRAGHSHFSPSSSAGWLNCAGYLLANAGKPDMAGEDAAYGTVAHGIAAVWLTAIRDEGYATAKHVPERFRDFKTVENGYTIVCDDNMLFHIDRYIDWCREVEIEGDVFIEQHVDYSVYTPIPNQGGTADHFVCVSPVIDEAGNHLVSGRLIITDLKMGTGVWVDVVRNTQALLYALGVFLEWDWVYSFQEITIRICQPRLDYFGVWTCSREDLLAFGEEVRTKAAAAWIVNAPRSPSQKACQWCADKDCVAKSKLIEDLVDDKFDDAEADELPDTTYSAKALDDHAMAPLFGPLKAEPRFSDNMRIAVMAWRYSHRSMIEKYFREIGEELLRLSQSGVKIPLFKVVAGRRSFKWIDEDHAATKLDEAGVPEKDIFKVEVTSVSAAKKALRVVGMKPKEIEAFLMKSPDEDDPDAVPLVSVVPGRPTLALSGDMRITVADDVDDALGDYEDDDEL